MRIGINPQFFRHWYDRRRTRVELAFTDTLTVTKTSVASSYYTVGTGRVLLVHWVSMEMFYHMCGKWPIPVFYQMLYGPEGGTDEVIRLGAYTLSQSGERWAATVTPELYFNEGIHVLYQVYALISSGSVGVRGYLIADEFDDVTI